MRIEWLGHACFRISHRDYAIVLDPFHPEMMKGYSSVDAEAQAVLCSHQHGDHNHVAAVKIVDSHRLSPFSIQRLPSFHDDANGAKRGNNTITILEADGIRVAHLGDLGAIPDSETIRALTSLDAMMIPVGGYYTIDSQAAKSLVAMTKPKVVIPMHYRGLYFGPPALASIDSFTSLFDPTLLSYIDTNVIDITKETNPMIAILTYLRP